MTYVTWIVGALIVIQLENINRTLRKTQITDKVAGGFGNAIFVLIPLAVIHFMPKLFS